MYKKSKYNYTHFYDNKIYCLNLLRGIGFPLKKEEYQKVNKLLHDPITFELEYPSIFKQFYKWGFIVDSTEKEEYFIYSKYINQYINNTELHLVILQEKETIIDEVFTSKLKQYINTLLKSQYITSLKIEWIGNNLLSYFYPHLFLLFTELKKNCDLTKLDFIFKLNIIIANNPILHNKLFHKFGAPTYDIYISMLKKIHKSIADVIVNLEVIQLDEKEIEHFHLDFKSGKNFEVIFKPYVVVVSNLNLIHSNYARKNLIIINSYNQIFSKFSDLIEKKPVGYLSGSGDIEWQVKKREKDLIYPWFLNRECNRCKFLPLLLTTCCNFQINGHNILCPLKNKTISADNLINQVVKNITNQ